MRFSIRHLLAFAVFVALSLQGTQAFLAHRQVRRLELPLGLAEWFYRECEARAATERMENNVCRQVLKDHQSPSEAYVAAKKRFELLQCREAH